MIGRRTDGTTIRRPLSPHLQVYDMYQMSSLLSILSRITGVVWAFGMLVFVAWLVALGMGAEAYDVVAGLLVNPIGQLVMVGLTVAAWYHTLAGIRHLFWDAGRGFEVPAMYRSGWLVILGTIILSGLTWLPAILTLAS